MRLGKAAAEAVLDAQEPAEMEMPSDGWDDADYEAFAEDFVSAGKDPDKLKEVFRSFADYVRSLD